EEESTNFYHPGFGIKVALRNYAPVPHLLPILRHLRGNLFSFYRGKIRKVCYSLFIIDYYSRYLELVRLCYSGMARRKYSDGVAAHTDIVGGWGRYWGDGGLLIQAGEFIVEPGEEGLF
ncbi:MAG: hypothetical protein IJM58_06460, partial [Muribaculaceae bacterium]|nr:hypothetical protein [Muribaculaceae bacterium]